MQHALSFIVAATTAKTRDTSQGKTADAQTRESRRAPLPFVLEHSFVSGPAEKKKTVLQEGKARLRKKKSAKALSEATPTTASAKMDTPGSTSSGSPSCAESAPDALLDGAVASLLAQVHQLRNMISCI